jgi:hypothetical protein
MDIKTIALTGLVGSTLLLAGCGGGGGGGSSAATAIDGFNMTQGTADTKLGATYIQEILTAEGSSTSVSTMSVSPFFRFYMNDAFFASVGIAIGSEKGLVVPIIRGVDSLSFAEIEKKIVDLANKVNTNKLSMSDLSGGTFSITNGGVYGSMMSTPIINPPQSAILGMHSITDRPMAIKNKVVIRPMMYVALSYDHRLVDGKQAVTFLVRLKEILENPNNLYIN